MISSQQPQFKHVSIGRTTASDALSNDAEDVITIGKSDVDQPGNSQANKVATSQELSQPDQELPIQEQPQPGKYDTYNNQESKQSQEDEINKLGEPMPLAHKLIMASSAVLLVVTIVLLVLYYA